MIPNVTMRWAQQIATCKWCPNPITAGTAEVVVFFWNKGAEGRRFNVKIYYHPQCWIDQGMEYLKLNPYVPHDRGRKSKLDPIQRRQRTLLLMRKAALDQRRKKVNIISPHYLEIINRMDMQFTELALEVAKVGGIPEKWLEQLTQI